MKKHNASCCKRGVYVYQKLGNATLLEPFSNVLGARTKISGMTARWVGVSSCQNWQMASLATGTLWWLSGFWELASEHGHLLQMSRSVPVPVGPPECPLQQLRPDRGRSNPGGPKPHFKFGKVGGRGILLFGTYLGCNPLRGGTWTRGNSGRNGFVSKDRAIEAVFFGGTSAR